MLCQDKKSIEGATRARLHSSEPCPDRVLAGRVRYLPDVDVLLLEVVDWRRVDILEDMEHYGDFNTDHKLIEVVRGRPGSYPNRLKLRYSRTMPSSGDWGDRLANPLSPTARVGDRVLFFTNEWFESCRVVYATPSALSAVRTTVPAPKRPEDEASLGIM
jgi:hypothetical protein